MSEMTSMTGSLEQSLEKEAWAYLNMYHRAAGRGNDMNVCLHNSSKPVDPATFNMWPVGTTMELDLSQGALI